MSTLLLAPAPVLRLDTARSAPKGARVPDARERAFASSMRKRVKAARLIFDAEVGPVLQRLQRQDGAARLDNLLDPASLLSVLLGLQDVWGKLFELPTSVPEQHLDLVERALTRAVRRDLARAGLEVTGPPAALPVDLYQTLTTDAQKRFRGVGQELGEGLAQAVTDGVSQEQTLSEVAKALRGRFGIADRRAMFLSRDLTGTAQAQITRARHEEVGVRRFRWSTAGDPHVRKAHRDLEGEVFDYITGAPGEGLPGSPYGCRCVAIPVVGRK